MKKSLRNILVLLGIFSLLLLFKENIYASPIIDAEGHTCRCGYIEKTCYRRYTTTCKEEVCDWISGHRICHIETYTCTKTEAYDCSYCLTCSNPNPPCPTAAFIQSCINSGCTGAVCGQCTGCPGGDEAPGGNVPTNTSCVNYWNSYCDTSTETAVYDSSVNSCICIDVVDDSGDSCDCTSVSSCQSKLSTKTCTYPKHAGIVGVGVNCYMLTCVDGSSGPANGNGGEDDVCLDIDCDPTEYCDDNGWTTTPTPYLLEDVVSCTALINCQEVKRYGDCYEDPSVNNNPDDPATGTQNDIQTLKVTMGNSESAWIQQETESNLFEKIKDFFKTLSMLMY